MNKYKQLSQSALKQKYGSSANAVRNHLVKAKINLGANTITLPVHEIVKAQLEAAARNYRAKVKKGTAKVYKLKPASCGSFCWRNIRHADGTTSPNLSMHSFGIAVDFNAWTPNGQGKNAKSDIPKALVKSMNRYGFFWGGDWSGSTCDPMHFEYAPGSFATVYEPWKVTRETGAPIRKRALTAAAKTGLYPAGKILDVKQQTKKWIRTAKGWVQKSHAKKMS
jgi:hypothetical protein